MNGGPGWLADNETALERVDLCTYRIGAGHPFGFLESAAARVGTRNLAAGRRTGPGVMLMRPLVRGSWRAGRSARPSWSRCVRGLEVRSRVLASDVDAPPTHVVSDACSPDSTRGGMPSTYCFVSGTTAEPLAAEAFAVGVACRLRTRPGRGRRPASLVRHDPVRHGARVVVILTTVSPSSGLR